MKTSMTILFALCIAMGVQAQEPTHQNAPNSPPVVSKDQTKSEVDLAVEDLKKRGETVITVCATKCKDSKDSNTDGFLNGRADHLEVPAYPAIAAAAHASGKVNVLVLIDKEGKVLAAQIIDGNPLLSTSALKAAKASSFSPILLNGQPQNVVGIILYNFHSQ